MTFTEAAEAVLRKIGKPLHYKKITQLAIEQNLLSHVGKTPEVTMSTRLATLAKKDRGEAAIVRMKPGVFGLRDWGPGAVESSGEEDTETEETTTDAAESGEANGATAAGDEPATAVGSPEEQERAQRLVAASQLFPEEEDDNLPVMAEKPAPAPVEGAAAAGDKTGDQAGRRRRRRRRRGRGGATAGEGGASDALDAVGEGDEAGEELLPGEADDDDDSSSAGHGDSNGGSGEYRAIEVPAGSVVHPGEEFADVGYRIEPRREPRREEARRDEPRRDDSRRDEPRRDDARRDDRRNERSDERPDETGRDAADLVVSLLTRRDDRQPVALRALVDDAIRSGKLSGDASVLISTLSAAVRIDAVRRESRGERPRLRIANGRVGLVDWALGPDLVRAEADALATLERLRDGARRQLIRRMNELPQGPFTEFVVLLLERMGISMLRNARRPGLPQGEVHLSGVARRGNEELKVAVLIKRGGEIGRERVIELRGSLHHYGPAQTAWILTTGNVLSGAREEASQPGTSPVSLIDGVALGRLLDEHAVGVRHAAVNIPYVDLDLFDALRV